jgi:hypothetical protein
VAWGRGVPPALEEQPGVPNVPAGGKRRSRRLRCRQTADAPSLQIGAEVYATPSISAMLVAACGLRDRCRPRSRRFAPGLLRAVPAASRAYGPPAELRASRDPHVQRFIHAGSVDVH